MPNSERKLHRLGRVLGWPEHVRFLQGGTPAAYQRFAEILILFYSAADNLAFAKSYGLLSYGFSDGLAADPAISLQSITSALTQTWSATLLQPGTVSQLEATELAGFAEAEAKRLFGRDPGLPVPVRQDYLTPWTAAKAEKRFLARFKTLHP